MLYILCYVNYKIMFYYFFHIFLKISIPLIFLAKSPFPYKITENLLKIARLIRLYIRQHNELIPEQWQSG